MGGTIALGVETALDTDTARRLHDYGALDDAGVAAALEQTGLQRSGEHRWPGYLTRIRRAAVVVDSDGQPSVAVFEAATFEQEHGMLESLFAALPDANDGRRVDWDGSAWRLLLQRAYHHQLPTPTAIRAWLPQPLSLLFDDDPNGPPDGHVGKSAIRLYGGRANALDNVSGALRAAVQRYVMDLRWRCVTGELDVEAASRRNERVISHVADTATGTVP